MSSHELTRDFLNTCTKIGYVSHHLVCKEITVDAMYKNSQGDTVQYSYLRLSEKFEIWFDSLISHGYIFRFETDLRSAYSVLEHFHKIDHKFKPWTALLMVESVLFYFSNETDRLTFELAT